MKELEKFSIDVVASGKKEMRKVREYLRGKNLSVCKRKDNPAEKGLLNYLPNECPDIGEHTHDFHYYKNKGFYSVLTLPRDWDKMVNLIEGAVEEKPKEVKFEVGDWIYDQNSEYCRRIHRIESCTWVDEEDGTAIEIINTRYRHATPSEIQSHLEATLKEKGFKEDCLFTAVRNTTNKDCPYTLTNPNPKEAGRIGSKFEYNPKNDILYTLGSGRFIVYEKGVFATLKETLPKINGYKGELDFSSGKLNGGFVNYGCASISLSYLECIYNANFLPNLGNRSMKSIILDSGAEIAMEQIKQILDYAKPKRRHQLSRRGRNTFPYRLLRQL